MTTKGTTQSLQVGARVKKGKEENKNKNQLYIQCCIPEKAVRSCTHLIKMHAALRSNERPWSSAELLPAVPRNAKQPQTSEV
jgi:hypothetical protein